MLWDNRWLQLMHPHFNFRLNPSEKKASRSRGTLPSEARLMASTVENCSVCRCGALIGFQSMKLVLAQR